MLPVPIANPAAVCRREPGGRAVLFNPDTTGALALNATGVAVWNLIDGRRDAVAIATALREQFSDAPPDVEADVAALIEMLAGEGLVGYQIWPLPPEPHPGKVRVTDERDQTLPGQSGGVVSRRGG